MKKSPYLFTILLIASIFVLSACQVLPWFSVVRGSGEIISESRSVSGFNAVQLDGAGILIVSQGDSESLEISADDNLMDSLTAQVEGNTLVLGYQDQLWRKTLLPSRPVVYNLTITDLTQLTLNGAGDLEIQSLQTDALVLEINGAGNIKVNDLAAERLTVTLAGTAAIEVSGRVTTQTINLDGAGDYQAEDLNSQSTTIEIGGLGSGTVWATDTLDITINGGGSVSYYGSPSLSEQISGLGEVKNLGEK